MERPGPPADEQGGVLVGAPNPASVAGYIARERQKRELRRERDHLLLDLARGLGEQGLAERFGVTPAVLDMMLADARERLACATSAAEPGITARRGASGRDRWPDADAHYEALGRLPLPTRPS
jgi:hypothetical protein